MFSLVRNLFSRSRRPAKAGREEPGTLGGLRRRRPGLSCCGPQAVLTTTAGRRFRRDTTSPGLPGQPGRECPRLSARGHLAIRSPSAPPPAPASASCSASRTDQGRRPFYPSFRRSARHPVLSRCHPGAPGCSRRGGERRSPPGRARRCGMSGTPRAPQSRSVAPDERRSSSNGVITSVELAHGEHPWEEAATQVRVE